MECDGKVVSECIYVPCIILAGVVTREICGCDVGYGFEVDFGCLKHNQWPFLIALQQSLTFRLSRSACDGCTILREGIVADA